MVEFGEGSIKDTFEKNELDIPDPTQLERITFHMFALLMILVDCENINTFTFLFDFGDLNPLP